jgi:hypothetical protein
MKIEPDVAKAILHTLFHNCETGVVCGSKEEEFILNKLSEKVSDLSVPEIIALKNEMEESGLIKPIQDIDYWKNFVINSAYEFKELLEGFKEAVIELANKNKNEPNQKEIKSENTSFVCNNKDCKLTHHNHSSRESSKEATKKVANSVMWAWGIFAACIAGLIGLIINGMMNKKDESENSIDSNNISSNNQTQSSINSIQSVIAKQKSLTSPSQQIARKTNSKIIPISSSSSRSPRVNSQAVTQTKNSQKNSQDPNPQNQAA